jgi:2'-5' RNA ligase
MGNVRSFIAVPIGISPGLTEVIHDLILEINREGWRIRWVNISQVHVTLRFLGEIEQSIIPDISASLDQYLPGFHKEQVHVTGFGYFGSGKSPRVIWMGLDNEAYFSNLKKRVDEALQRILPEDSRQPFKPHVTLGRVRRAAGAGVLDRIFGKYRPDLHHPVEAKRVVLYRSDLSPKGPLYTALKIIE